jgi:hypothetical protein
VPLDLARKPTISARKKVATKRGGKEEVPRQSLLFHLGKTWERSPSAQSPVKSHRINGSSILVRSHNPKVVGSNPTPATNSRFRGRAQANFFFLQPHYSEVRKGVSWGSPSASKLKVYSAFAPRAVSRLSSIRSKLGIIVRCWEAIRGSATRNKPFEF